MLKAGVLALAVTLAAAMSPAAWAVDVDQIEIKSRIGEPLLAEIPVVSDDPAELQKVQAQLASAVTFARVGLQRPHGVVAELRFAVVRDKRGKSVIRITTASPVQEDFFTFLIEVNWGSGRMVREYSVSLGTPNTLTASQPPLIQAPVAGPSNAIAREPESLPDLPQPIPLAGQAQQAPASLPAPVPPAQMPPAPIPLQGNPPPPAKPRERPVAGNDIPAPAKPKPAPRPDPKPKPAAPPEAKPAPKAEVAAQKKPVPAAPAPAPQPAAAGAKAERYGPVKGGDNLSKIAANLGPEGYTRDQVMLALLRTNPGAFIGGNINLIRKGATLHAPSEAEVSRFSAAQAAIMVRDQINQWRGGHPTTPQPAALAGEPPRPPALPPPAPVKPGVMAAAPGSKPPPRAASARLEIVPAASAAERGASAGTRSGIAAGGGGGELRQELQQTQETLASREAEIRELRDRLSGLEKIQQDQQKLIELQGTELAAAQRNTGAAQKREAEQASASAKAAPAADRAPVWPWLVGALVLLLLLVWLVSRLRGPAAPARRAFDPETLAAAVPSPAVEEEEPAPATSAPTWHGRAAGPLATGASPASDGLKRIRLAQAYLDLGDFETGRRLLQEVADSGEDNAGEAAARLLRALED
ncbi:FimV/HubP family polar landmark protein [Luteimonas aquatica]|uniref:FimV/HubP family polar landmark protein n=1 Tax=Luteimonas aquatica TaxID=450364 RepID=UPI001F562B84|nr:FimV/HubP family polar landmark protein [Luteimonas aquatica]